MKSESTISGLRKNFNIVFLVVAIFVAATLLFGEEALGKERVIAHGGGSIRGFETTSSVEAVKKACDDGFKLIELDMVLTADEEPVMLHDWDRSVHHYLGEKLRKPLTFRQFEDKKICGEFEALTFKKLTAILDTNPEVRIVSDTKYDNLKLLKKIAEKYPKYVDRIVAQIYAYEEYEAVKALGYEEIILTLYRMEDVRLAELIEFAKSHKLYGVTVYKEHKIIDIVKILSDRGISVYVHPVSDFEEAEKLMTQGAYGVYSSKLLPQDMDENARACYLMQETEEGQWGKLTDCEQGSGQVQESPIKLKGDAGRVKFEIEGSMQETLAEALKKVCELNGGDKNKGKKYSLKLHIEKTGNKAQPIQEYVLYCSESGLRILDKRYEYRLENGHQRTQMPKDMGLYIDGSENSKDVELIKDIMLNSLVAMAGTHHYYFNGQAGSFYVNKEVLRAQRTKTQNVVIPMADTVRLLGVRGIRMDSAQYMHIYTEKNRVIIQTYALYGNKNGKIERLEEPLRLYRGKAMAGGQILNMISEREYIDDEGVLIVLPAGVKKKELSSELRGRMVQISKELLDAGRGETI